MITVRTFLGYPEKVLTIIVRNNYMYISMEFTISIMNIPGQPRKVITTMVRT